MRQRAAALLAIAVLVAAHGDFGEGSGEGQWLGFTQAGKHGRQATGSSEAEWAATLPSGTPLETVQLWFRGLGGTVSSSSPALSPDGAVVFVGSYSGNTLHAVRSSDGTRIWTYATDGIVDSSPAVSADGKRVFVGSCDDKLHAVNASNGAQIWAYTTGGDVYSCPTLSPDGDTVFIGSEDGKLHAVQVADGVARWTFSAANNIQGSPPIR